MPSDFMINMLVRMPMPVREYWIEIFGKRGARALRRNVYESEHTDDGVGSFEHYIDAMIRLSGGRQPSGSRARNELSAALYFRSRKLYSEQKFTSALNYAEESLALKTEDSVTAGENLVAGAACWALGRFKESIRYSEKALGYSHLNIGNDNLQVLARANIAMALVELGVYPEAIEVTKPEHNPHWPNTMYLLEVAHAWALIHAGEIEQADRIFKELEVAITTAKEVSARRYYQYRAKHRLNLGLVSFAIADLNHVLKTFGPSPLCVFLLTEANLRAGKRSEAERCAVEMQSTFPDAFHTSRARELLGAATELA